MTAHATELTPRAIDMPAGQMRVFVESLGKLGYDPVALLARAGLRPGDLADPDARIPCTAFGTVFGSVCAQRRTPDLAARMAFETPIGAFPLLDYLVLTADTVGDALKQLERFLHVTAAPVRLELVAARQETRLVVHPGADTFAAQYETAMVIHHLRRETTQRFEVSYVSLIPAPDDRASLERLLGAAIRSPAAWSGLAFSAEALRIPLRRRDPVLRRVLESQAAAHAPPDANGDLVTHVRDAIGARLGRTLPTMQDVARALAMAPRTLQRRLAQVGMSWRAVVDLARRDVAQTLLKDASLSVAEIGYLLGFSEPSAFHRAFKRWLGVTPVEFRRSCY